MASYSFKKDTLTFLLIYLIVSGQVGITLWVFGLVLETRFEGPHTPDNFRLMESLSLFFSMNDMTSLKALCEGQRVRVQQEVSSRAQLPGQGTLAVLFLCLCPWGVMSCLYSSSFSL